MYNINKNFSNELNATLEMKERKEESNNNLNLAFPLFLNFFNNDLGNNNIETLKNRLKYLELKASEIKLKSLDYSNHHKSFYYSLMHFYSKFDDAKILHSQIKKAKKVLNKLE